MKNLPALTSDSFVLRRAKRISSKCVFVRICALGPLERHQKGDEARHGRGKMADTLATGEPSPCEDCPCAHHHHRMQSRRDSNGDVVANHPSDRKSALSGTGRHRPASLSPFRPRSKQPHPNSEHERWNESWRNAAEESPNSSQAAPAVAPSGGLFNWRKKYPRRSSSSSIVPTSSIFSSCVGAQGADSVPESSASSCRASPQQMQESQVQARPPVRNLVSTRRMSQPSAFSLPQFVRRSLQPLISSSPSTDADDQSDSVSKLRYMKCKQVQRPLNQYYTLFVVKAIFEGP